MSGARSDPGFLTVPNLISLSRVPIGFSFLAVDDRGVLAALIAIGAFTDLLDGAIARLTATESEIGVLLDPFCDKLFVTLGLISFLPTGHLDWAGLVILLVRDVFTAGAYLLGRLTGRIIPFRSRPGGKLTTALQVGTFFALIFRPEWVTVCVLLVGAVSVYAIIDYGMAALRLPWAETGERAGEGAV